MTFETMLLASELVALTLVGVAFFFVRQIVGQRNAWHGAFNHAEEELHEFSRTHLRIVVRGWDAGRMVESDLCRVTLEEIEKMVRYGGYYTPVSGDRAVRHMSLIDPTRQGLMGGDGLGVVIAGGRDGRYIDVEVAKVED